MQYLLHQFREHWQKTFVTLSGFCPSTGWGVWVNPLKKKIRYENLFRDNTEWISKNLRKMISADVKANKRTRNKRSGGSILQMFIRRTFRTWNTSHNNVKNSKKYPLLTLATYFDTTFTINSFIKSSVTF